MKGEKNTDTISPTQTEICKVFIYFLNKDEELLTTLREYYEPKTIKEEETKSVIKTILSAKEIELELNNSDRYKTVVKHINKYYKEKDKSYFDPKLIKKSNEKITRKLASIYLRLSPQYKKELQSEDLQTNINITETELEKNLYSNERHSIKKHKSNDITLVYRWADMNMFIGREKEIKELHHKLLKRKNIVISGIRGIGKTGLIQAYLSGCSHNYDNIIWVSVYGDFKESFVSALKDADEVRKHGNLDNDTDKAFERILFLLNQIQGNNLIIFDNAWCPHQINEFICTFKKIKDWSWRTVYTTHCAPEKPIPIQINTLSPEEAFLVFKSYYLEEASKKEIDEIEDTFNKEKKQIMEMLKKIKYHTLLIELIAKVDIEDKALNLEHLFDIVKDATAFKSKRLARPVQINPWNPATRKLKASERTPYKYILAIFKKDMENLSEDEKQVLTLFSALPLKPVPLNEIVDSLDRSKDDVEYLLNRLKGWIKYDEITKSYSMEELYQFAVRELLIM